MRKRVLRLVVLFFVGAVTIVCMLMLTAFYALDGASLATGINKGEPILLAIEQYRQEKGIYPNALNSLIPEYFKSIPQPAWRYKYSYETCSSNSQYVLWFRRSNDADTYCGYASSISEWICSDSIPPECNQ